MHAGSGDMVRLARASGVAIPAFNIPYLPMVKPVMDAVRDCGSLAFLEVARLEWEKFASGSIEAVAEEYHRRADRVLTRLHLDHVPVVDEDHRRVEWQPLFRRAIAAGYDSLMLDGSRLPFAENAACTREAAAMAHASGLPCEAELGAVLGHEEGPLPPYEELFRTGRGFTDPAEAAGFVRETGCDWLSVAVGNVHGSISRAAAGQRKVEARLSLQRIGDIAEATGIPLVLHGGTGIRPEDVREGFRRGIAKINVGADLRQAWETTADRGTEAARRAVYERTVFLLKEVYRLAGTGSIA